MRVGSLAAIRGESVHVYLMVGTHSPGIVVPPHMLPHPAGLLSFQCVHIQCTHMIIMRLNCSQRTIDLEYFTLRRSIGRASLSTNFIPYVSTTPSHIICVLSNSPPEMPRYILFPCTLHVFPRCPPPPCVAQGSPYVGLPTFFPTLSVS